MNIDIDTIMISEEDSLLGYVNEMEKYVKGRSYYINPADIDKVLLTDYLTTKNKRRFERYSGVEKTWRSLIYRGENAFE